MVQPIPIIFVVCLLHGFVRCSAPPPGSCLHGTKAPGMSWYDETGGHFCNEDGQVLSIPVHPDKVSTECKCVFPFTYGGKAYHSCIPSGGGSWCANTADYDTDKLWTYCAERKTSCKCVFPFKFGGKYKGSCITDSGSGKHWCGTSSNYDQDNEWAWCVEDKAAPNPEPAVKCPAGAALDKCDASFCKQPHWVILGQTKVGSYQGTAVKETKGVQMLQSGKGPCGLTAWAFTDGHMKISQSEPVVPDGTSFTFGAFVKFPKDSTTFNVLLAGIMTNGGSPAPYAGVYKDHFGYKAHFHSNYYTVPDALGTEWRFVGYSVNVDTKTWFGFVDDKVTTANTYGYSSAMSTRTAGDLLVGRYMVGDKTGMTLEVAGMTLQKGAIDKGQVGAFVAGVIASVKATA